MNEIAEDHACIMNAWRAKRMHWLKTMACVDMNETIQGSCMQICQALALAENNDMHGYEWDRARNMHAWMHDMPSACTVNLELEFFFEALEGQTVHTYRQGSMQCPARLTQYDVNLELWACCTEYPQPLEARLLCFCVWAHALKHRHTHNVLSNVVHWFASSVLSVFLAMSSTIWLDFFKRFSSVFFPMCDRIWCHGFAYHVPFSVRIGTNLVTWFNLDKT